MADFKPIDNNATIPDLQPAQVVLESMENKNLLEKRGDIYVGTGSNSSVQIGSTKYIISRTSKLEAGNQGQILVVDDSEPNKLKWGGIEDIQVSNSEGFALGVYNGVVKAADLAQNGPEKTNGTETAFISNVSQMSNGSIVATRQYIPYTSSFEDNTTSNFATGMAVARLYDNTTRKIAELNRSINSQISEANIKITNLSNNKVSANTIIQGKTLGSSTTEITGFVLYDNEQTLSPEQARQALKNLQIGTNITISDTLTTNSSTLALSARMGKVLADSTRIYVGDYGTQAMNGGMALGYNASSSGTGSIVIGDNAQAANSSIALGYGAAAYDGTNSSIAIGNNAICTAAGAIQLGEGQNNVAGTVQIKSYRLLENTGRIVDERLYKIYLHEIILNNSCRLTLLCDNQYPVVSVMGSSNVYRPSLGQLLYKNTVTQLGIMGGMLENIYGYTFFDFVGKYNDNGTYYTVIIDYKGNSISLNSATTVSDKVRTLAGTSKTNFLTTSSSTSSGDSSSSSGSGSGSSGDTTQVII